MNLPIPTPTIDAVTLGEAMALLVAQQPGPLDAVQGFDKCTAGAETNVAIGLARLGLRVRWISRLGDDSFGHFLHHSLSGEGIDCSAVGWDSTARTGMMLKTRATNGRDPQIEYHRKGSAASRLGPADLQPDSLLQARHLHLSGVYAGVSDSTRAACQQAIRWMRVAGRTISFDTNLRPALWASPADMVDTINRLAAQADWVLPGVDEGEILCGSRDPQTIARHYLDRGVGLVVVKLGPDGAYWARRAGTNTWPQAAADAGLPESGWQAAVPVSSVVDTVGAGDGFAAGLISGLLQGQGLRKALARAAWIGARAVQVRGDTEGLPTAAELADWDPQA